MQAYHSGPHAQAVSDNIARNPYLPKDSQEHKNQIHRTMAASNPSTVSRAHWQPEHHDMMKRAHEQYQRQIDSEQSSAKRGDLAKKYGAALHGHFQTVNRMATQAAARVATRRANR